MAKTHSLTLVGIMRVFFFVKVVGYWYCVIIIQIHMLTEENYVT